MTPNFDQLLSFIHKQWNEKSGLAIAIAVTFFCN
jgi:hypothetical protein